MEFLHRDTGQHVAVGVRERAAQVVAFVQQACRHMMERHLLPGNTQQRYQIKSFGEAACHSLPKVVVPLNVCFQSK